VNRSFTDEDGVVETCIDNHDGTATVRRVDAQGVELSVETLQVPVTPPYPSLDPVGALATLLVVEGQLPLIDAANAIHEEPAHLEHEAQAWSI
jgi:hypothetical protein